MSLENKQPVSYNAKIGSRPSQYQSFFDISRFIQIQNMIQQTNEEIEALKARIGRLEEMFGEGGQPQILPSQANERFDTVLPVSPLPIAELKELAEMAKRFR